LPNTIRIKIRIKIRISIGDNHPMFRSSTARAAAIAAVILIALGVLRYKPWQRPGAAGDGPSPVTPVGERPQLTVGFLPVT
jgi:hypothetical protein